MHDDPTLCYVLRGRFTEYSRGLAVDCTSDTLKITPAGEDHWNRFAAGETHGLRIDVDRSRFGDSPAIHHALDERMITTGLQSRDIIGRLLVELDSGDSASGIALEGLLLELIAALARDSSRSQPRDAPPWLREAHAMIREMYASQIRLATIADSVGVAPATLARGYRTAYGRTIGDHIRELRLERAVLELAGTGKTLSDIAMTAGFYDQSHFTNLFRRRFGMTPAEYRASAWSSRGHATEA
jgi:AraC family transcriptional regulator